jgi:hypothetical protein
MLGTDREIAALQGTIAGVKVRGFIGGLRKLAITEKQLAQQDSAKRCRNQPLERCSFLVELRLMQPS